MSSFINKLFNTSFLQNKFVLYASLFVVLFSIVRHISNRNINAVVLMALIGLVTSYFSKNMIIILLTAFSSVFLLEMIGSQTVEGMENDKKDTTMKGNANAKADDEDEDEDEAVAEKKTSKEKQTVKKEANTTLHGKKDKPKKTKQGMASLSPASYDGEEHGDDDGENAHRAKEANRIDYASTLEEAYDNIENIIGEDGVRGLTDQTKSLMNQQKELMNNMKEMGPLLKSAESFMGQLTGNGGIKGITDMLKGFATPGGGKK